MLHNKLKQYLTWGHNGQQTKTRTKNVGKKWELLTCIISRINENVAWSYIFYTSS